MNLSPKPLFAMTAADLMTPTVVTLPEEMRLPAAARMLCRQQVSGAPVVDHEGRCVGVLSTTDFMRWAEGEGGCARSGPDLAFAWQVIEDDELPQDEIRRHMTADPVTVTPDASIVRVAEMMCDAHIHRVIVVDGDKHPVGVVTTTDILAALVRSARTTP